MLWFILYILFGLQTALICTVVETAKGKIDYESMLIQFALWPFVSLYAIGVIIKYSKEWK